MGFMASPLNKLVNGQLHSLKLGSYYTFCFSVSCNFSKN